MSACASAGWKAGDYRRSGRRWRPWEIVAMVAGFIVFWPVGLAFLFWKLWGSPSWSEMRSQAENAFGRGFRAPQNFGGFGGYRPTGNAAFEEYRRAELDRLEQERRRLEEESRAFTDFVEELKRAKDREEFEAFMRRRRQGDQGPASA